MTTVVNIHEAKTHFSSLVRRAHDGEEILVAKAGTPYAKLVPLDCAADRRPGLLSGRLGEAFFEPLPEEELERWER